METPSQAISGLCEAVLGWVRKGRPPPATGVRGITPGKFLK
jgi:hypothetical protein